jgi:hypothetical protein
MNQWSEDAKQQNTIHLNMPQPSSLEKEVLSNYQHSVAANNHMIPLILREKVGA